VNAVEARFVEIPLERVEQRIGAHGGALRERGAAEVACQAEGADVEALLQRGDHRVPHRGDAGEAVDQD
jgi:hypothetical protein